MYEMREWQDHGNRSIKMTKAGLCANSQEGLKRASHLHDGLARVDRTAGDTWRRPRGEDIYISASEAGIAQHKTNKTKQLC